MIAQMIATSSLPNDSMRTARLVVTSPKEMPAPTRSRRVTVVTAWTMTRAAGIDKGAPRLGEHNAYVLGDILGLSADQQRQLADSGVTR